MLLLVQKRFNFICIFLEPEMPLPKKKKKSLLLIQWLFPILIILRQNEVLCKSTVYVLGVERLFYTSLKRFKNQHSSKETAWVIYWPLKKSDLHFASVQSFNSAHSQSPTYKFCSFSNCRCYLSLPTSVPPSLIILRLNCVLRVWCLVWLAKMYQQLPLIDGSPSFPFY